MAEKFNSCLSVKAKKWLHLFLSSAATGRPPLLDIRSVQQFMVCHVQFATHFEGLFGSDGLAERLNELPPPQFRSNIAVLGSTIDEADCAISFLSSKGYSSLTPLTFGIVNGVLPLQSGYVSRPLWEPSPIISEVLPQISSHIPQRTVLDIGAGSGRNAAWLKSRGFNIIAVDRDSKLIEKLIQLADRTSYQSWFLTTSSSSGTVRGITRTMGANLNEDLNFLTENAAGLLVVVRFLRRGVLDLLWRAVLPGGFVIYEHFLKGCEKYGGPKKASQMLEPNELGQVFSASRGFTVLQDIQTHLPDGRPISRFVAKRC